MTVEVRRGTAWVVMQRAPGERYQGGAGHWRDLMPASVLYCGIMTSSEVVRLLGSSWQLMLNRLCFFLPAGLAILAACGLGEPPAARVRDRSY